MLVGKTITIIGAGQMGEAMLRGFLNSGVLSADQITLCDIDIDRLKSLNQKYGVKYTIENAEAVASSDIVILAVKPQQIRQIIEGSKIAFNEQKTVISIAAGVTTSKLINYIEKELPVIRVMPNTPALAGKGMSVICKGEFADGQDVEMALKLFKSVGKAIELPESEINSVTAVSGSGPAYFFLVVEKLIEAAINAGLNKEIATELAIQTFVGSAALIESSGNSPEALREMVTSPGGTTAAALQVFNNYEFGSIVQEAVDAAIQRAGELA